MYRVDWVKDGIPGVAKYESLYALAEWIQNLHWWGVKPTQINIRYEE